MYFSFRDGHVADGPERAGHPLEHLRAEHRAFIVDEREDHRLLPEILRERDLLPLLVGERQVERDLFSEALFDADLVEDLRGHRAGLCVARDGRENGRRERGGMETASNLHLPCFPR
jgi:hypothetical protein